MNDTMTDKAADFQRVLEMIRDGREPCRTCKKPHELRPRGCDCNCGQVTWADPDDGHPYRRMDPDEVADDVLAAHMDD